MSGAVITGSFAMAGLGAYYLLANRHIDYARLFVTLGVIVGLIASIIQLYPSGDAEGLSPIQHASSSITLSLSPVCSAS